MYADHIAVVAAMGVGIILRGLAVGRPTGVADAAVACQGLAAIGLLSQNLQPSLCFHYFDGSVAVPHRHSGGIITSVLQLGQSVQQNRRCLMISHKSYNTTHTPLILLLFLQFMLRYTN